MMSCTGKSPFHMPHKMATICCFIVCSLFILNHFPSASSMYEDESGKKDWKLSFIGRPSLMLYDQSSHNLKRFVVTTETGVLAGLNSRTGKTEWRHVFDEGVDLMVHEETYLVTYHSSLATVRRWDLENGFLVWETTLNESLAKSIPVISLIQRRIVILTESEILSLNVRDGSVSWQQLLDVSSDTRVLLFSDKVVVVGSITDKSVAIAKYSLEDGSEIEKTLKLSTNYMSCISMNSILTCLDGENPVLYHMDVTKDNKLTKTSFESLKITASPANIVLEHFEDVQFLFILRDRDSHASWLLRAQPSEVALLYSYTSNALLVPAKEDVVVVEMGDKEKYSIEIYKASTWSKFDSLISLIAWPYKNISTPTKGLAHVFTKTDSSYGYQLILLTEDDVIVQAKYPGELGWIREEAPAVITSHLVCDMIQLNSASPPSDQMNGFASFVQRLRFQFQQLQENVKLLNFHSLMNIFKPTHVKIYSREEFDTRKMMVFSTLTGKIFGILTENGKIEWTSFLHDLGTYENGRNLVLQIRDLTHSPKPALVVVLGPGKDTCSGTVLVMLNPLNGEMQNSECLPFQLVQALSLPITDSEDRNILLLVTADGRILTYPSLQGTTVLDLLGKDLFVYLLSNNTLLEGYQVKIAKETSLIKERTWSINFETSSQSVVTMVTRSSEEVVNAQAKVTAKQEVIFKYLNPHIIAIATESEQGGKSCIDVYLVDSVSGNIVSHFVHKQYRGPVQMVLSENWLVYFLYNTKSWRYELVVVELYDKATKEPIEAQSSLTTHLQPDLLRQSYIFPQAVVAMTTTQTLKGISERSIIFGMFSGHLFSLPKGFLDPKRNFSQTEALLPPYYPELAVNASAFINYNQTVSRLKVITSHSTGLESTSLIVSYGLDLFVTLVTPSKAYDQLADDFDHKLVAMVLGGLCVGVFILSQLTHRKLLRQLWK